jgi:hypothetical protein
LAPKRPGRDWWSLQPLRRIDPPSPAGISAEWSRSAIDRFVYATLKEKGLDPAPPADSRTLIRRVTYDLLGLPPTPEEVEAFVADPDPDFYEKLVDRLLASPHYGERWGRHWLDVVRFGESHGYEQNHLRDDAWPYRDYVIRAFNQDTLLGMARSQALRFAEQARREILGLYPVGVGEDYRRRAVV